MRRAMRLICNYLTGEDTVGKPTNVNNELDGISKLYRENLDKHGPVSQSVGWKDEQSQALRFDKLIEAIQPEDARDGFNCNDWGCGYGAMSQYLLSRSSLNLTRYIGYDICDEMLEQAKRIESSPHCEFVKSHLPTKTADYTFVSGTFNVKLEASEDKWKQYIEETLFELWEKTNNGLAFNLLTTYVDWKEPQLYYADPAYFFDFCKRRLSPRVSLLHDYPLYEWTMLVRKEI